MWLLTNEGQSFFLYWSEKQYIYQNENSSNYELTIKLKRYPESIERISVNPIG